MGAHLNGDLLARLAIDAKLDLGKVAGPESLPDLVLIDDRLVDVRVLDLLHQHSCACKGRVRGLVCSTRQVGVGRTAPAAARRKLYE